MSCCDTQTQLSTIESLHIGQWAMGGKNRCPLPIAYCPVAPSLHFSGNGQWAVGGCMHTNLPPIAFCRVLHGQWAMSIFFPPIAIAHCSALPSGCIRGQWALGGMPPALPTSVAWATIWGIFAAQMGNGQRGRVTLSQCKHRRPLPIAQYASSLLLMSGKVRPLSKGGIQ